MILLLNLKIKFYEKIRKKILFFTDKNFLKFFENFFSKKIFLKKFFEKKISKKFLKISHLQDIFNISKILIIGYINEFFNKQKKFEIRIIVLYYKSSI